MTPFYDYAPDDMVRPASVPLVSIMTFCQHPGLLYGTVLTFRTLRVGFPTADVEVWDNGSRPDLIDEIRRAAEGVGARFTAMRPRHHSDHLRWLLLRRSLGADRSLVLCDPDVVFYQDVQGWDFGGHLMAGRLIPEHGSLNIRAMARLHPSLLFIPSLERFRRALPSEAAERWNAIGGTVVPIDHGRARGYDTMSPTYLQLRERCIAFTGRELDAFTHLFMGTHAAAMGLKRDSTSDVLFGAHRAAAEGNLESLRGIWRRQEAMFTDEGQVRATRGSSSLDQFRETLQWQGRDCDEGELEHAVRMVRGRLIGMGMRISNTFDATPPRDRPKLVRRQDLFTWAR